jgi:chromate transporter
VAPTPREAFGTFATIGWLSFGGPSAQIALMHRMLVDERRWMSEAEFLRALSFCMLLPGPEAMQLATYAGWRLHGLAGGLVAGLLFILPGAAVVLALTAVYALYGNVPIVAAIFLGVQAAVLAIVVEALLRIARRALKGPVPYVIAAAAFVAIYAFAVPFPVVVIAGAVAGAFLLGGGPTEMAAAPRVSPGRTLGTAVIGVAVWLGPLALIVAALGGGHILADIYAFFAKLAVVTFGGAYAVLAYMVQEVVAERGWLTATEMLDGLGLAETTPGPLILVVEFVGALAAFRAMDPPLAGLLAGAAVALWATFVPSFLFIFAGAPYVEWLTAQRRLRGALAGITSAVVGVILNLSVWFGLHVLFGTVETVTAGPLSLAVPDPATLKLVPAGLALVAALLLFWRHAGVPLVLGVCAGLAALNAVLIG